jgi:carboxypeptidase A2
MRGLQLLALFVAFLAVNAVERKRYDGYQLLRIYPKDHQLEFVYAKQDDAELDFWYEGKERVDVLVPPHKVEAFKYEMTSHAVSFIVENTNIQRDIDVETLRLSARKPGMPVDYDDFNQFDDIIGELDTLAARCPPGSSCETFIVGQSYDNRPIKGLRIFSGSGRRAIWLDATIHAREWLSTATHLKIVKHLIDDYADPVVANLLATYDFWLVPVSNPDGYVYTQQERLWRKNRRPNSGSSCIGTDLNRNYDQQWGNAGASTNPCSETFRGPSPASEVETQAVQAYILARGSSLVLAIHFHTYGQLWLMPWGSVESNGQCALAPTHAELLRVANAGADAVENTHGTRWERGNSCQTIYPASGITMDYSHGVAGVPYAFTPELRGNNFIIAPEQIQPSFEEVWNGIVATVRAIETTS